MRALAAVSLYWFFSLNIRKISQKFTKFTSQIYIFWLGSTVASQSNILFKQTFISPPTRILSISLLLSFAEPAPYLPLPFTPLLSFSLSHSLLFHPLIKIHTQTPQLKTPKNLSCLSLSLSLSISLSFSSKIEVQMKKLNPNPLNR
jgi:hypothetical protein